MEESKKFRSFRKHLNLNGYQFIASKYNYGSTYMNLMGTTNQKPTIDTQKNQKEGNSSKLQKKIIKPQEEKEINK